jgi:hypothetical protein
MPSPYEVLILLSAPQGYLTEIKRTDLPLDVPDAKVYQWLWIQAGTVTTLQFVGMATSPRQQRTFKEAQLWFDDREGELCWTRGRTEPLAVVPKGPLPQYLTQLLNLHLS